MLVAIFHFAIISEYRAHNYLSGSNNPFNGVYLLNVDDTEKMTCSGYRYDYPAGLNAF